MFFSYLIEIYVYIACMFLFYYFIFWNRKIIYFKCQGIDIAYTLKTNNVNFLNSITFGSRRLLCFNTSWHNCCDTFILWGCFTFFLLLTWEADTSGNSFKSATFINHFPLFQLWCMKAFTLVRFQKYLKLMSPISSFRIYYKMISWEHSHLCPVSSFWSSGNPE